MNDPGPYERQMGRCIVKLLHLFVDHVSDAESLRRVTALAANPNDWSAGHSLFDEVRGRYLNAVNHNDDLKASQYFFEESCCQALYNAVDPPDPFDPSSAFFVAASALGLARIVGVPLDAIADAFVN